jgi:hypothetical protein
VAKDKPSAGDIRWATQPADHDYPAAASYLSLVYNPKEVTGLVRDLSSAETVTFKAKDVFRASGLSLLGVSNSHVEKDREKIRKRTELSPILLVQDDGKVVIADGYHRMCAVYSFDEDAEIPCRIVSRDAG